MNYSYKQLQKQNNRIVFRLYREIYVRNLNQINKIRNYLKLYKQYSKNIKFTKNRKVVLKKLKIFKQNSNYRNISHDKYMNSVIYFLQIKFFILLIKMNKIQCFGCLNPSSELLKDISNQQRQTQAGQTSSKAEKSMNKVTFSIEGDQNADQEAQSLIYFNCECCQQTYCIYCCTLHMRAQLSKKKKQSSTNNKQGEKSQIINQGELQNNNNPKSNIKIICQQCQSESSMKYCENCQQFLCQKCSFKIHNKGKRAKHDLDDKIAKYFLKTLLLIVDKELLNYLKQLYGKQKKIQEVFKQFINEQLKNKPEQVLLIYQQSLEKELQQISEQILTKKAFKPQQTKYSDLLVHKNQFPFLEICKIIVISSESQFQKILMESYQKKPNKNIKIQTIQYLRKKIQRNHERANSQKIEVRHNKNISNFSNLSAISKVQNQSVMSNQPSDLFESNELSLNITLNQNSSILMMGALSDRQKQQKQEKKSQVKDKQTEKASNIGHHRIYSIRQENSHNQANNMSTSTENSIRKRNKKWPIPYFQPFRIPKYLGGVKYSAQVFLRQLAQKGILMIRRQKAEQFLLDPDISRSFVRNIGEKQIQYIAYIIDFLSVECLAWVIESIKQDMMTPSQKLIQSRLKESFDLKINVKLWDSIIKYLQSPQYDQDYFQNTKCRYVPKISVVKYGEEFLLEFQQRKWAYQDQQLLDQEQQEWKQFKKLITDYFNGKSQITGGRYGCVQYVKLNGPKPLRKCSLGKISMYVQEAINKGIIRYHKTLLVSNSQNNTSMCSNANGIITNTQQLAQFQKDIKIMGLQIGLIDMFLQNPPNTPISMAQIPLNLKSKVYFDYNLVDLGFPKLKNLLNTLNDKMILQSTKTHTTYETTTNGSEAIQKLRAKFAETSQNFLIHILTYINQIITYYTSITLQDLYSQLSIKLGFPFDFKIYAMPDFYQFAIYYCSHVINVQIVANTFVAYAKYPNIPYQNYQTHRTTYSQEQYPSYNNHYQMVPSEEYSKTTEKKHYNQQNKYAQIKIPSKVGSQFDPFGYSASVTPKFNNEKKNDILNWDQCYENSQKKQEKNQDYAFDDKLLEENIINIIDDGDKSASHPKTVIVNESTQFNNANQFCLGSKDRSNNDQYDNFYDGAGGMWGDQITEGSLNKYGKIQQHLRVKSTNLPTINHTRVYSTIQTRK